MNYNAQEVNAINNVFEDFSTENISYVVPRGHQELPKKTPGGDIDVLVADEDFNQAKKICEYNEFLARKSNLITDVKGIFSEAILNPRTTIDYIINSPNQIPVLISERILSDVSSNGRGSISDWRGHHSGVMFHLRNHLAYKSPWASGEYRICPKVENSMLENSHVVNGISIPDRPDELAHLICRGLFDKQGDFPDYYIARCKEILDKMTETDDQRFKNLLSLIFYDADKFVYEQVKGKNFGEILDGLKQFSDY
jgi:hypothetical protein